jgi:hypothetical protein
MDTITIAQNAIRHENVDTDEDTSDEEEEEEKEEEPDEEEEVQSNASEDIESRPETPIEDVDIEKLKISKEEEQDALANDLYAVRTYAKRLIDEDGERYPLLAARLKESHTHRITRHNLYLLPNQYLRDGLSARVYASSDHIHQPLSYVYMYLPAAYEPILSIVGLSARTAACWAEQTTWRSIVTQDIFKSFVEYLLHRPTSPNEYVHWHLLGGDDPSLWGVPNMNTWSTQCQVLAYMDLRQLQSPYHTKSEFLIKPVPDRLWPYLDKPHFGMSINNLCEVRCLSLHFSPVVRDGPDNVLSAVEAYQEATFEKIQTELNTLKQHIHDNPHDSTRLQAFQTNANRLAFLMMNVLKGKYVFHAHYNSILPRHHLQVQVLTAKCKLNDDAILNV